MLPSHQKPSIFASNSHQLLLLFQNTFQNLFFSHFGLPRAPKSRRIEFSWWLFGTSEGQNKVKSTEFFHVFSKPTAQGHPRPLPDVSGTPRGSILEYFWSQNRSQNCDKSIKTRSEIQVHSCVFFVPNIDLKSMKIQLNNHS